jgi:hypothetical protein
MGILILPSSEQMNQLKARLKAAPPPSDGGQRLNRRPERWMPAAASLMQRQAAATRLTGSRACVHA